MKISDSEKKIMDLVWENGGPVTTAWLTQRLGDTGWKATTILYRAAVSREDYRREETQSFFQQIHGGSYHSLFAALCAPGQLDAQEVEELRRWFEGGSR